MDSEEEEIRKLGDAIDNDPLMKKDREPRSDIGIRRGTQNRKRNPKAIRRREAFAERFMQAFKAAGYSTPDQLATVAGVSVPMIRRYISGRHTPGEFILRRMAIALQVNSDYLSGRSRWPTGTYTDNVTFKDGKTSKPVLKNQTAVFLPKMTASQMIELSKVIHNRFNPPEGSTHFTEIHVAKPPVPEFHDPRDERAHYANIAGERLRMLKEHRNETNWAMCCNIGYKSEASFNSVIWGQSIMSERFITNVINHYRTDHLGRQLTVEYLKGQ